MSISLKSLVAALFPLVSSAAYAQSPLIIDQNRADRQIEQLAPKQLPAPAPNIAARVEQAGSAVPLRAIRIQGSDVPPAVVQAANTYIGKPASKQTLQGLANAITAAFAKEDIALYTVVIPPQDLSQGVLFVAVAQGYISNVVLHGEVEGRKLKLVKAYAGKLTQERPLRRPTLERYLSLIRDIPGITVDAQLLKGEQPGAVRLALGLKQKRFDASLSYNNRGTGVLGNGQFQANLSGNGLLRDGDQTMVTLATAQDFKQYRYVGVVHSTPIGNEGARLAANAGYIETRPKRSILRGEARTAGLQVSAPLIRGYTRNLFVTAGIDGLNSDNAILGTVFSSERTRALRATAGYSDASPRRSTSGSAAFSRGIDGLGARTNPLLAQPDFTKLNLRASVDQAIGKAMVLRLRAVAQLTSDPLPAAERFTLGGAEFGRAFETALLSGDRGRAGSAEFAWRAISKGIPKVLQGSEIYGFADAGKLRLVPRGFFTGASFDLASAGGGVRAQVGKKAMLELEAARSLNTPYPGYNGDWRVSVSWRLALKKS